MLVKKYLYIFIYKFSSEICCFILGIILKYFNLNKSMTTISILYNKELTVNVSRNSGSLFGTMSTWNLFNFGPRIRPIKSRAAWRWLLKLAAGRIWSRLGKTGIQKLIYIYTYFNFSKENKNNVFKLLYPNHLHFAR